MKSGKVAAVILLGLVTNAMAHTGHGVNGWAEGLMHPLTGVDHLLAMVTVGVWATRSASRSIWVLPTVFVLCMLIGACLGLMGAQLPMAELSIKLSVITLGLFLAFRIRLSWIASISFTSLIALFHGYVHGNEAIHDFHHSAFILGMVSSTMLLHLVGVGVGCYCRNHAIESVTRLSGALLMSYGLMLLSGGI